MKRYNNLFDKIVSLDNLYLADKKARRNKSNRKDIKEFDQNKEESLKKLQQDLINGTYKTSEYNTFIIREPKERLIFRLPYYPDRIVHHAVMNIMEPIWVSIFIKDTYSCIKHRGIHEALHNVKEALKDVDNTTYCLKLDIRKFYPILDEIIDSAEGVPIGNYLSQFFANLYLTYFDHWLKEDKQVKYYFRYADDIVILHNNKEYLWSLFEEMKQYIATLKLSFKDNYQIFKVEDRGISFVGYVIRHDYTLVRKNIKRSMCRKAARLGRKKHITVEDYKQEMCSHIGWLKHCNGINLLKKILRYKELLVYARRLSKQKL